MTPPQDDPLEDPELKAIRDRMLQEMTSGSSETKPQAPDHPLTVEDATLDRFVREHDLVLLDMWAPWCGPCRMVGPILEELADELKGKVVIGKVNVDENPRSAQRFGVQGIPTMLLFKGGELVERVTGAAPKEPLRRWLLQHATN